MYKIQNKKKRRSLPSFNICKSPVTREQRRRRSTNDKLHVKVGSIDNNVRALPNPELAALTRPETSLPRLITKEQNLPQSSPLIPEENSIDVARVQIQNEKSVDKSKVLTEHNKNRQSEPVENTNGKIN